MPKQFPGAAAAWAQAQECGCDTGQRCAGNATAWGSDGVWLALNFSLPDAHNYMPGDSGTGTGTASQFTAFAKGDLDCDTTLSQFIRSGGVNGNGDVTGSYQPQIINELE